jgi:hypothetical protein
MKQPSNTSRLRTFQPGAGLTTNPDRPCIKCGVDLSRWLRPAEVIPMGRNPPGPYDEPPVLMEPESRLSTEPWMKHPEVSALAALIAWFGMPKRVRGAVLRGAWMATLVVAALVAVSFGIAGFVLLVDWALLHG